MEKNKKIVKYRKPLNINIGLIIFGIIFIYLIFNVYTYLTETHISMYEVEQGTIAENNIYNGLIIRSEKVFNSDYTGAVNYYVKEASKISYQDLIYSVDENGDVAEMINQATQDGSEIDNRNLDEIEESILSFKNAYNGQNFYNVYSFKENINSALSEALSLNALNTVSDYVAVAENNNTFHQIRSAEAGIVAYYTDGYEGVTVETFSSAMFDAASYTKENLKSYTQITAGTPAYKLIDSEIWNIILQISEDTANELAEDDTIQIRFVKDSKSTYATYTIEQREGAYYLIMTLRSAMVRYALDRYVEVELITSEETGLKIPNSAITEKEFYTIPIEYFLKGGDSSNEGLLLEETDDKGAKTTTFITPTIYYETDQFYYVDSEDVSAGDILLRQDSSSQYEVGTDTATLQGVYNINKGYAVFKQIDILYQNEEYTIVRTGTKYGISLYDHIALDGTKVNENELIK